MNTKSRLGYTLFVIILFSFSVQAKKIQAFHPNSVQINKASQKQDLVLSVGIFDPKFEQLDFASKAINSVASSRYGIVQFTEKASYHWLNENGFKVIQSLSNNAYVVNWQQAKRSLLLSNKNIRWFDSYQSGFKISPKLWNQNRKNQIYYEISVQTFNDTNKKHLSKLLKKYLPKTKTLKTSIPKGFGEIVLEVKASNLDESLSVLSSLEDVQWLEPYVKPKFFNTEAVSAVQAGASSGGSPSDDIYRPDNTPIFYQGIWGTGQIVGIADSGLDRNEDWFVHLNNGNGVVTAITDAEDVSPPQVGTVHPDNKVYAYWTMPGAQAYDNGSFHGTHTTGSIAGDRQQSTGSIQANVSSPNALGYDNDDGMAPGAQILFDDIGSSSGLTGAGSIPMWQQAFAAGAAIHSNSYGSSTNGAYSGSDRRADEALRGLDDMIILFAAGNDDGQVNSTSSPGNAKNVTTVGALLHGNSTSVAFFSNKGPTDDGRLKPDISATGSSIESAAGDSNNSNIVDSPSRRSTSGTSMSTPITAGATALLRQYFTDGFYPTGIKNNADSHTPSGTLMKAMLLNGTNTDGGFFANNIGWGRVWLENTMHFDGDSKRFRFWEITNDKGLQTGEQFSVTIPVQANEEFRATLVWYDLPGPTGSGVTLVNNLDLKVEANGGTYLGNNFSSNNSITTGTNDVVNTVEQVRFANPIAANYTITVDAANIIGDGSIDSDKQGFALVVSGDLSTGNTVPANPINPSALTVSTNTSTSIDLSWSDVSADYDSYEIYRTLGTCASADLSTMRYLATSNSNNYSDNEAIGGYQYAYKIRAFSGDLISDYTNCIDATSQQICLLVPQFDATSTHVDSNSGDTCHIDLQWDAASSSCPTSTQIKYNVYRSTTHNFTPSLSNRVITTSSTAFSDNSLVPNQVYFYVVQAEDNSGDGSGVNGGNQTTSVYEVVSSAVGSSTAEGSIIDDVDNLSLMQIQNIWSISNDQSSNGSLSYRSAAEGNNSYSANICGRMYSTTFEIGVSPTATPSISYQARYDIEPNWDGVVVEISTDDGATWVDLPPDGGYSSSFSETGNPPINICGYSASHGAFNGSTNGSFQTVTHDLSSYTGQQVQIRWNISTDPGTEEEGFYLDELAYNNILAPLSCTVETDLIYSNGFE
jgi:hypothetical protein